MWRKTAEKIAILQTYYSTRRGVGHSNAMIFGARNATDVIILVHDQRYGSDVKRMCPNAEVVTWESLNPIGLLSRSSPLVIDHHALKEILDDAMRMLRGLQEENAKLVSALWDEKEAAAVLGRITSEKKAKASRENGKKGGRPRRVRGKNAL